MIKVQLIFDSSSLGLLQETAVDGGEEWCLVDWVGGIEPSWHRRRFLKVVEGDRNAD